MSFLPITDLDRRAIRLIATDMDGTLTEKDRLSGGVIDALERLHRGGIAVLLVTGRSAGWVAGLAHYLPLAGAIAENGGVYFPPLGESQLLGNLGDRDAHRQHLGACFQALRRQFPHLQEAADNVWRWTDWTFDIPPDRPLAPEVIGQIQDHCRAWGLDFTHSAIQGHLKPPHQDKGNALRRVLAQDFSPITPPQIITVGDSPNDAPLFDPQWFPQSVGVANLHTEGMKHHPRYRTHQAEGRGFQELAQYLLEKDTGGDHEHPR